MKFWEYVNKTATCWLWKKARTYKGYGVVWHKEKLVSAHRLSWQMKHGDIPDGQMVLHKCDVRHCVRPTHLFLGTAKDNTQDMMRKGRHRTISKLTPVQVSEIRSRWARGGITQRELADIYGVHQSTISIQVNTKTVRDEHGRLQPWEPKAA